MKMKFLTLICASILMFMNTVHAKCSNCPSTHEGTSASEASQKTYLQPEQIAFHNSKIYVLLDEDVFLIPAIYSDQGGLFILGAQPRGRCEPYEWKCPKCGKCGHTF